MATGAAKIDMRKHGKRWLYAESEREMKYKNTNSEW